MKTNTNQTSTQTIDTPILSVKDNLFTWKDTVVQIPNISLISASQIEKAPLPIWTIIVIAIGIFLFQNSAIASICLIAAGIVGLYLWYAENNKRTQGAIMTVQLNSGSSLYIQFKDKEFLGRVIVALRGAIADGRSAQLYINVQNCKISNSSVLDGLTTK